MTIWIIYLILSVKSLQYCHTTKERRHWPFAYTVTFFNNLKSGPPSFKKNSLYTIGMTTIKSKDLSFNKQEPAFLRRIREANSGHGDRHERPIARPQRLRDPNADEEDAPTYVDEGGDNLSKAEYDALVKGNEDGTDDSKSTTQPDSTVGGVVTGDLEGDDYKISGGLGEDEKKGGRGTLIDVGGPIRKRKAARVVGDEVDHDEGRTSKGDSAHKKAKKKGKPIKLSFGDDET